MKRKILFTILSLFTLFCICKSSYIVKLVDTNKTKKNPFTDNIIENVQILRGEVFRDKEEILKVVTFTKKHATGCSRFPKSMPIYQLNNKSIR